MAAPIAEQISLFRYQLQKGIFNDVSLRILESILVVKDVRSLVEIRSAVQGLLRSEATLVMKRTAAKTAHEKLCIAEFFVKAFALVGDSESCLALKYEALVLRDTKYHNDTSFRVSYQEWYTFAKDSLDSGYYSIAIKGFDNTISSLISENNETLIVRDLHVKDHHIIEEVKNLRDKAASLVSSQTVQALSFNYLKRKSIEDDDQRQTSLLPANSKQLVGLEFRVGINRRNTKKLRKSQRQHVKPRR